VARGLERMRTYLSRRGLKTSTAALGGLLSVNLTSTEGAPLTEATVEHLLAVVRGQGTGPGWELAGRVHRRLAWRHALTLSGSVTIGFVVLTGGGWAVRDNLQPPLPASPPFRPADARVALLGREWSGVVVRAARLLTKYRQPLRAGDPRSVDYQGELNQIVADTVRISTDLSAAMQGGDERALLAEFLTVELSEVLALGDAQRAAVYALLRQKLAEGPSLVEAMRRLVQTKTTTGGTLRSWLSPRQQRRFARAYRADSLGLFAFVAAAVADK
jgi:hypothetical protein